MIYFCKSFCEGVFFIEKVNIVPCGVLSLCSIFSSIISINNLESANPSHVHGFPSSDGVVYPRANTSVPEGIQIHVSLIEKDILLSLFSLISRVIFPPLGVNLIALLMRFSIVVSKIS